MEEQGKLIELPCKPGDVLYKPTRGFVSEYRINFIEISICMNLFFHTNLEKGINDTGETFRKDDIGKTIFLTEQEAKEALEGMKNGD